MAGHDFQHLYPILLGRLREAFGPELRAARLLDFGCGYTSPLPLLLRDEVAEIVGVDIEPRFTDGLPALVRWHRGLGPKRALLRALRQRLDAVEYFRHLAACAGQKLDPRSCRVVQYDGSRLPFADASFGGVVSNAVLQELPLPLERFAGEIARVLRPGGRIDLQWHNWFSWSGNYLSEEENHQEPWGHLRGGRADPALNRLDPDQVVEAFRPWFDGVERVGVDRLHRLEGRDAAYTPEAAGYLTPELQAQLPRVPREWLHTRGYVLLGCRR